jgi:hypothetical protein
MKNLMIIALSLIAIHTIAQEKNSTPLGPKGGVVKTVQNYNIELLNSVSIIYVYLYDKSLNAISNSGVLSEIILCYSYEECLNKPLKPLGKNGFSVSVANPQFDYCDITLIIDGKPLKAKFNNSTGIAENK